MNSKPKKGEKNGWADFIKKKYPAKILNWNNCEIVGLISSHYGYW